MHRSTWMAAIAVVVLGLASGSAASVGQPLAVLVSDTSPFLKCADTQFNVFANAEVEPSIAVNPTRPRNIIVVYQQDRYADGAARGIVSASSFDAGHTWTHATLPVGFCAHARLLRPYRTTDPWVSFGVDGRAYGLASNVALTSADGGKTWGSPVTLAEPTTAYFLDKGSLTADPIQKGVAYAVWARYRRINGEPPTESDAMFAKTMNGGQSWSTPIVMTRHGRRAGPIASQIVVDPVRKRLYHLACWVAGVVPRQDGSSKLIVQHSDNGGRTWSKPQTIAAVRTVDLRTFDPGSRLSVRTGFVVPGFALNRGTGVLYTAWQDDRFSGGRFDQILVSHSNATGWTKPTRISPPRLQAFDPTIAVNDAGVLGVGYYEMPAGSSTVRAQYRFALSKDGGAHLSVRALGAAFRLGDAPMLTGDAALAAPPGLFLGDYMGLTTQGNTFHMAFVTTHRTRRNRTDVYVAEVKP